MALGIVALILEWWGILIGVGFLAWGIAGALGKVKGPINLVFHDSRKKMALNALSLVLGGLVTTCGVLGAVAEAKRLERETRQAREKQEREAKEKLDREQREAEDAAAKTAREHDLQQGAAAAAAAYGRGLDEVEALVASGKWSEAKSKLKDVTDAVAEHRALSPIPAVISGLLPREAKLGEQVDAQRRQHEAGAWIERARAVVSDKDKCENQELVEAAMIQVDGLRASDPEYALTQDLVGQLRTCLDGMPPPSAWDYDIRRDPMGGTIAIAAVSSTNTFEFDFPYQGSQHATLVVRKAGGLDVMLSIEQGQFICMLGCSVLVRFDDGKTVRWRASDTADHSTTTIFLRRESDFVKALSKARVVRIEATFFQEGTRVLEFPVARFDLDQLKG